MSTLISHRKLLTIEEAAQHLGMTVSDVDQLVVEGKLSAYRLGGQFVRFRADDIAALAAARSPRRARPRAPTAWLERLREFFYLHDFYLLAALLTLFLIAILIRFA